MCYERQLQIFLAMVAADKSIFHLKFHGENELLV